MKILEIITESKTQKVKAPKPPNFVAKHAMKTTSGAGAHKNVKKSAKDVRGQKHKTQPAISEASDQSTAISQEQLNQMYAKAKPMMFIKNTPVALVPLAKINQIGTPQQVQQVQKALGSVDQTSYTDEYKNKGYVVFQWNGTALDLYVASPEVVAQKYVKFNGQLPQDDKSRGKIPSLVALGKLGIDPSKVPFFVKKVPTQMVSAKQLGLEGKTIQTSWGEQTVSPGGFMVREENGHIYTVAPDAKGLPIGYLRVQEGVAEAEKKGLYYYVNKRKKAGTSRDASSPKAPTAQAWKDAAKTAKKEGVAEGSSQTFDMSLAKILKQRGYKGPVKLEQLGMKWVEAIGDIVDIDDYIMIQGKDPEYDGWVSYVFGIGKYAYGAEQGYQTGTAKRVEIDTREPGVSEGRIDEKAKSKAQQKFMGMVYAAKKGEKPASPEVAKAASGMSKKSAKDYAQTKHKGKPEHVKEDGEGGASAGSTTSAMMGVGAVYKNKRAKKQKPGTNALDMKGVNLLTGGSIKR